MRRDDSATRRAVRRTREEEFIVHPADRFQRGVNEAVCRTQEWEETPPGVECCEGRAVTWAKGLWKGFTFRTQPTRKRRDWIEGFVGFPSPDEAIYHEVLCSRGPLAIKANLRMWGLCYRGYGCFATDYVTVDMQEFTSQIGFKKDNGRSHDPENVQAVYDVLRALTRLELAALYHFPGKGTHMLAGDLWTRGFHGLEVQNGAVIPVKFQFKPGVWFSIPDWRRLNDYTGFVGQKVMDLHTHRDKWAIMLAGDLVSLGPMGGYTDRRLTTADVMRRIGLSQQYGRGRDAQRRLERALDRLTAIDVLASWQWARQDTEKDRILVRYPVAVKERAAQLSLDLFGDSAPCLPATSRSRRRAAGVRA